MSDYSTLVNRVLDDIDRQGSLTSQAQSAIQTAIDHYEGTRFYFNQERATAQTVNGQEFFPLPTDVLDIDVLSITVNGYTYKLDRRTYETLEDWFVQANTYLGYPSDYAIYNQQIRLYPVPNADGYTLTLSYAKRLDTLENDADENEWTGVAEELIRSRADADISFRILQDEKRAVGFKAFEQDAYQRLVSESNRRMMTGRARKTR